MEFSCKRFVKLYVTVYRSYELTTLPNDHQEARLTQPPASAVAVTADSVPDIKIYRRSAVLYTGDDDDDDFIIHHRPNNLYHRSVCLSVCHTHMILTIASASLQSINAVDWIGIVFVTGARALYMALLSFIIHPPSDSSLHVAVPFINQKSLTLNSDVCEREYATPVYRTIGIQIWIESESVQKYNR